MSDTYGSFFLRFIQGRQFVSSHILLVLKGPFKERSTMQRETLIARKNILSFHISLLQYNVHVDDRRRSISDTERALTN